MDFLESLGLIIALAPQPVPQGGFSWCTSCIAWEVSTFWGGGLVKISYALALLGVLTVTSCTRFSQSASSLRQVGQDLNQGVFLAACTSQGASDDAKLAQALRRSQGTRDCARAWEKLKSVKALMMSGDGISDLKLLAVLPWIEELYLTDQEIKDLSVLGSLPALRKLDLSFNQLESLKGLERLAKLEELRVSGNHLEELEPLAAVKSLRVLDISENAIVSLRPLAGLAQLTVLELDDNLIRDLSPLSRLFRLEQLSARRNHLESVEPIAHLARLNRTRLKLEGNPIKSQGCPKMGASAAVVGYCLDHFPRLK